MDDLYGLAFLFIISFLAATILPAQSELVLAALLAGGKFSTISLVCVATLGNVLGAIVNWFLGRYLVNFQDRRWFPIKPSMIAKATNFYQKYGTWTLLFSWLPFIGDAFTLVAGIFKTNIWLFIILVTIGKGLRYLVIVSLV